MDIAPHKVTITADDASFLGSKKGVDTARTITLDLTTFVGATHFPNGFIPAGAPVVLNTTSHLYEAPASGATVSDGHLMTNVQVNAGSTRAAAPLGWEIVVRNSKIPFVPAAKAPDCRYVA